MSVPGIANIFRQTALRRSTRALETTAPRLLPSTTAASRCLVRGYRPAAITAGQRRALSTTVRRRFATPDDSFDPLAIDRESDQVDVCIVGGGPAGLSAAIKLKQLANEAGNEDFRV
ncbi:hypothetical protein KC318_g12645, partial [Hortaea werneckii]